MLSLVGWLLTLGFWATFWVFGVIFLFFGHSRAHTIAWVLRAKQQPDPPRPDPVPRCDVLPVRNVRDGLRFTVSGLRFRVRDLGFTV